MYNLFVSGREDAWQGEPIFYDIDRCINIHEGTSDTLATLFASLNKNQVEQLKQLPCIFAYEAHQKRNPKFGFITEILNRHGEVRISYTVIEVNNFITLDQFADTGFDLDIADFYFNRTHWAVKDVDLFRELGKLGIDLPKPDITPNLSEVKEGGIASKSVGELVPENSIAHIEKPKKSVLRYLNKNAPALMFLAACVAGAWTIFLYYSSSPSKEEFQVTDVHTIPRATVDPAKSKECNGRVFATAGSSKQLSLVSKIRGLAVGQGACPIRDTARFQCI